jgi:hypothetical protein
VNLSKVHAVQRITNAFWQAAPHNQSSAHFAGQAHRSLLVSTLGLW